MIIPSLNDPHVGRAVAAVRGQVAGPPDEIIVVGRDDRAVVAATGARFVATPGPQPPGAARNRGAGAAAGDVLLFLDADCVPEPDWLRAHLAEQAKGHAVVGGMVRFDPTPYWRMVDNLSSFHEWAATHASPRPYLPSLNLSVAAEVFAAVGPMDEARPRGEDIEWTMRAAAAGHTPWYAPDAMVWHRPAGRDTMRSVWARWKDKGRWMIGLRRAHPDVFGVQRALGSSRSLRLLAPLIAAAATAPLYGPGGAGRRYWRALPAVYLTKIAWCWGAATPASGAAHA